MLYKSSSLQNDDSHYAYIDVLRGLAFTAVFSLHVGQQVPGLPKLLADALGRGWAGVQLFYVVSAVTLCLSMARRTAEPALLRAYALRRLFRIAPMFWTTLLLSLAFYGWGPRWGSVGGLEPHHVALAALFLHGFDAHAINGPVPGGWSVAVEMQFYLLLPLIVAWVTSLQRAVILVAGAVAVSTAALPAIEAAVAPLLPAAERQLAHEAAFFSLPVQFPVFCLGVLAYRLIGPDRRVIAPLASRPRLATAVLIAAAAAVSLPLRWREGLEFIPSVPGHVGYGAAFVLLILGLAIWPSKGINPLFQPLGTISYSAYLLHFMALSTAEAALPPALRAEPFLHLAALGGGALILTVAAAALAYALVEVPGRACGRWLIGVMAEREVKAPAGAVAHLPAHYP